MKGNQYYKLARPDGFDWHTGKTINYRENVGKLVKCPSERQQEFQLCSVDVLHACPNPNDCFVGAQIPCSAYLIEGKPVVNDGKKFGFRELKVIEEIKDLDKLFGWKYSEAINPIDPLKLKKQKPTKEDMELLKQWASVWASVWDSVGDSVWASVWDSVWNSVGASVGASVGDSVGASVWDSVRASVRASVGASVGASVWDSVRASVGDSVGASVRDSVRDSVRASVGAYMGSMFPNIKGWKYINHKRGEYPFQPCVDLWRRGFVASFDGKLWRLHSGRKATVVYELNIGVKK